MVRCFVGFLLSESSRKSLVDVQKYVESLPIKCKLVEPENLHINFSFLGEVKDENIEEIKQKLDHIASDYKSFEAKASGLRAIPNPKFIRVIAMSVNDENNALEKIRERVRREIGGDSKPMHLTLCRVKEVENKEEVAQKLSEKEALIEIRFTVDSIQLIKSELSRSGPTYIPIHEARLL